MPNTTYIHYLAENANAVGREHNITPLTVYTLAHHLAFEDEKGRLPLPFEAAKSMGVGIHSVEYSLKVAERLGLLTVEREGTVVKNRSLGPLKEWVDGKKGNGGGQPETPAP